MNVSSSPSITFMLQYTEANSGFVDYTNRDEAVEVDNELNLETHRQNIESLTEDELQKIQAEVPETKLNFQEYIDYMNRSYATENQNEEMTAIFTKEANYLQRSKVTELKSKLEQAYQNGSLLWQGVISFDNDFLANEGLYDLETGKVDQQAIKSVIREALPRLIEKEGLSDSSFWWANIHLNTDNIHVHFGLSEVESAREKIFYRPRGRMEYRGNFSQKTIERFKSDVFHGLLNEQTRGMIVRREQILANIRSELINSVFRDQKVRSSAEKNFLEQAYNHLPMDKKWRYGSNARDFAVSKFFIDRYLDSYLENDGKELYQEFLKETKDFLETYRGAYSAGKKSTYEKIRKLDGRVEKTQQEAAGYHLQQLIASREKELRERLANKILHLFRENAPEIADVRLEKNLSNFSVKNQQMILEQDPNASVIKTLDAWKKLGYELKDGAKHIEITKPVYAAYDKHGTGLGRPEYVRELVYDVSQLKEDLLEKQLTLRDLSLFSSADLKDLVEAAKKKSNRSLKERQELGTFRYALKLSLLEEKQSSLLVRKTLFDQIQPLETDKPFVELKKKEIQQRLKLTELQLTPNYKLGEADQSLKQSLANQFEDSVSFPVDKADSLAIQAPIKRLKGELAVVQPLQDEGVLTILKGYPITKDSYIEELQTHISIFQLKHQIYSRNKEISQTTDQATIQKLKRENAKGFSELKSLYQKILPEEESNQKSQLAQAVSHKMQERKNLQRKNVQQSQGKAIINTDFMRNLTNSLQRAQRANKKALMERERSDERQELEEKGQSI